MAKPPFWNRRRVLKLLAGSLGLSSVGYVLGVEPNGFVIERHRLPILPRGSAKRSSATSPASGPVSNLSNSPLRILHLSDIHLSLSTPLGRLAAALDRALKLGADCCVITGDFITQSLDHEEEYAAQLRRISAHMPCFAVLGNHDGGQGWDGTTGHCPPDHKDVERLLEKAQITLLHNRSESLTLCGQRLHFVGTGDLWQGECDPEAAFSILEAGQEAKPQEDPTSNEPTIVLSHNPDAHHELAHKRWDALLCGHTHGGQVVLPGFGPLILPIKDRRFAQGLRPLGERWIYTSRGMGSLLSLRFNCPPEIALLELTERA